MPGVRTATFTETAMPPYIGFNTDFEIAGRLKTERQQADDLPVTEILTLEETLSRLERLS